MSEAEDSKDTQGTSLTALFDTFPELEIEAGTGKYVLIALIAPEGGDMKMVVRQNIRGAYHADVASATVRFASMKNLQANVVGGGRIRHDVDKKETEIYGYSVQYGKADHSETAEIISKAFPDHKVTWRDDGY